jgi:hypothetical protein
MAVNINRLNMTTVLLYSVGAVPRLQTKVSLYLGIMCLQNDARPKYVLTSFKLLGLENFALCEFPQDRFHYLLHENVTDTLPYQPKKCTADAI